MVELSEASKGNYRIERYAIETLPRDAVVDGNITNLEAVADAVKRAWKRMGTSTKFVAMALPAAAVITKKIIVQAGLRERELEVQVESEANQYILNLEVSALEADGKGKIISSPRVITADQVEALIEQGVEIPYQQATSSGATSVSFRKANLSLKVKPQIAPDGRVNLTVDVNKDSPNTTISTGAGVAIDTKHVKTEVLVENGGTVVIGGIYTQDERVINTKIPLLGDVPYVGFLFRHKEQKDNKTELLVFITPKIISQELAIR
ncbi:MAG: hypothetical protein FJY34_05325 [Betaproteobacteria bacterium]|nr:hypothetical protein [Betaproteobacteria bacterium]